MAKRLTSVENSNQDKQHRSDLTGNGPSSISSLSFSSQSSELPVRSGQGSFQELTYQWPSQQIILEARTPLAIKNETLQQSTSKSNTDRQSKKRLYDGNENLSITKEQGETRKQRKTLAEEKNRSDHAVCEFDTLTPAHKLKALAETLADDTPLGRLMENAFMECDTRMKEREQNLAMVDTAAPPANKHQGESIEGNDNVYLNTEKYDTDIRVWNICATRIMSAVKKERSLRAKRRYHQSINYLPKGASPRFAVWRD